jgi:tRNA threonylcarbamoyladenosine biosynthesis protein TsaE
MNSPASPASDVVTSSEAETAALGESVAAKLAGGETLLLFGELGAGKTAFVRGLARGLGINAGEVVSPTFVMLTRYDGRLTLHHADLYRLAGGNAAEERELGLEELPGPRGVLALEWAERLASRPGARCIRVTLEHAGGDKRRVRVEGMP